MLPQLNIDLQGRDPDDVLVSGHTYREYLDAYNSEVAALSEDYEFQQYLSEFTLLTILLQIQCMMKFGH